MLVQRRELDNRAIDCRFGAIIATIVNMMVGKKGKPVSPLQIMGYEEDVQSETDKDFKPTAEQKKISQMAVALNFRLMKAASKRSGKSGG